MGAVDRHPDRGGRQVADEQRWHRIGARQGQLDGLARVFLGEVEFAAGDRLRGEHACRQRDRPISRGEEPRIAALGEPVAFDGLA